MPELVEPLLFSTAIILSIHEAMTEFICPDVLYRTCLDPPPGPPTDSEGNFIPMEDWRGQPIHIHPPKGR
jgi:hypothetical protein